MDSYKVNARAWKAVMDGVKRLRSEGRTLDAIGHQLKIGRATVKKWLDSDMGGERTSFRDMVRYLDVLNIPLSEVFGVHVEEGSGNREWKPTDFELRLAGLLKQGAKMFGKRPELLSRHIFGDHSNAIAVQEMLDGKREISVEHLYKLCKGIGLEPADVLNRVTELVNEEAGVESSRRTA